MPEHGAGGRSRAWEGTCSAPGLGVQGRLDKGQETGPPLGLHRELDSHLLWSSWVLSRAVRGQISVSLGHYICLHSKRRR